jgi:hypothetical protein
MGSVSEKENIDVEQPDFTDDDLEIVDEIWSQIGSQERSWSELRFIREGNPYHDDEGHFTGTGGHTGRKPKEPNKGRPHAAQEPSGKGRPSGHQDQAKNRPTPKEEPSKSKDSGSEKPKDVVKSKGGKSNRTRRPVAKGYKVKPPKEKDSERSAKAKAAHKPCNKAEKDYAKANEHKFASHIGGEAYPNNAPQDVDVKANDGNHHLELKSMLSSAQGRVNMATESVGRKVALSQQTGNPFHIVVLDDRDTFGGGANKDLHSGHRMYFKDGISRYNISQMHPVKDEQEIKELLDTPYDQWPAKAKASKDAVAGMKSKWRKK